MTLSIDEQVSLPNYPSKISDKLHRDAALLNALMASSMIDAIIVSDANGIILRINAAASHIFGHEDGALVGESINRLMPPAVRSEHDNIVERYLETGKPHIKAHGREIEGMRDDGSVFPLHVTLGHIDLDGEMLFIAMMHDITERKQAENALNQASRMEAIGQLTGGFAHDFNNLLTIAIGNLELLRPKLTDEGQLGMLQDALESVELGAELTGHLLAFARRSILEPVTIDINAEIERAIRLLRHTLNPGIQIKSQLAHDPVHVLADPARLQTAMLNLALNAQDAMPRGGVLTFETALTSTSTNRLLRSMRADPGKYVQISVHDTGAGMDTETARQVFDPFFTTKAVGHGTGLGLAMVHGFIHQSGGQTDVETALGSGTTIHLYLPLSTAAPSRADTSHAPERSSGQTILVVEDDDRLRNLTITRVQELGHLVIEASDAKTAINIIESGVRIDVLFTDIAMPGEMDGRALARHVQATRPDIGVLLTTGFSESLLSDDPTDKNQFPILKKPYHQNQLAQMLGKLLNSNTA
ncbi:PAS domain-containing hybrid sensor histidine kinase/response regulator [Roseovarius arcticus]|uniref:PAS domain-containing hybrid sensor histidine kinase/response regulator n=1 Tax=Roseovarius arcticus TaxID=2547404 RepID=UPI0014870D2D|nr:PAS domain-containing hybrid sensor histidine kinase/response regulator [Roseovarius arcticus]